MSLIDSTRFHAFSFGAIPAAVCLGILALTAAGCDRQAEREPSETAVAGQVFMVLPTSESLRLGSVRVQVFSEEQIQDHLKTRENELAARSDSRRREVANLEKLAEEQRQEAARAERIYLQREREIRGELSAFLEEIEARVAEWREEIGANASFIKNKDTLPPAPEGIPTREESEAYEAHRRKWLSMTRAERDAWADALTVLNVGLEDKIESLHDARDEKIMAFGDELQALDLAVEAAQKAERETVSRMESLAEELARPFDYPDYLSGLPAPLRELRTDADGEFLVKLPPDRRYVVFAETGRRIGGEQQELQWLVQVSDYPASRIVLSNHNLVTAKASENVIKLSAKGGESGT